MKFRKNIKQYKDLSDEKLMQFICNGEIDAFNELYKRYKNRILYYFYRMLGNSEEKAQDFLQELFYKIIEKPHQFDHKKHFKTWIFSIANNMCKNEYRRIEVRNITSQVENADVYVSEENNSRNIEYLTSLVYEILNNFDESHKSCFLLKYREGFSVNEISEILEISEGTIKSRLFYTRKKIEEQMREKYPEMVNNYLFN